jgi:hypothetical protein
MALSLQGTNWEDFARRVEEHLRTSGDTLTGEQIVALINACLSKIVDDNLSVDVNDAIAKKHMHSNSTVLDATQESFTTTLKTKLDGIAEGANNYSLPVANASALGGIKSGTDITVDASGNVSVVDDSHNHIIDNVDGLQSALNNKQNTLGFTPENLANKGAVSGYAELDSTGKVPSSQLPSYVDDVVEGSSLAAFPTTGESGKIYIAIDTGKTYRWGGSTYAEISASLALGETS